MFVVLERLKNEGGGHFEWERLGYVEADSVEIAIVRLGGKIEQVIERSDLVCAYFTKDGVVYGLESLKQLEIL